MIVCPGGALEAKAPPLINSEKLCNISPLCNDFSHSVHCKNENDSRHASDGDQVHEHSCYDSIQSRSLKNNVHYRGTTLWKKFSLCHNHINIAYMHTWNIGQKIVRCNFHPNQVLAFRLNNFLQLSNKKFIGSSTMVLQFYDWTNESPHSPLNTKESRNIKFFIHKGQVKLFRDDWFIRIYM